MKILTSNFNETKDGGPMEEGPSFKKKQLDAIKLHLLETVSGCLGICQLGL